MSPPGTTDGDQDILSWDRFDLIDCIVFRIISEYNSLNRKARLMNPTLCVNAASRRRNFIYIPEECLDSRFGTGNHRVILDRDVRMHF